MDCKYCSRACCRSGKQRNGIQRFYCTVCKKYQQQAYLYRACEGPIDNMIKSLVCESVCIRGIARVLKIAANTVLSRIQKIASPLARPAITENRPVFEVDELWTYIGRKDNEYWLAYGLDKATGNVMDFVIGKRTKGTLKILIDSLLALSSIIAHTHIIYAYVSSLYTNNKLIMIGNKHGTLIIFLIGIFIFNGVTSCNTKQNKRRDCSLHYKTARIAFNAYYKTNDTTFLQEALGNAQQSMKCPETRYKSIQMKITLLILLKRYETGVMFMDSLSDDDFNARYKKKMSRDYFEALEYGAKSDTSNKNSLLKIIVSDLQKYIQSAPVPKDSLDEEACLLFFGFQKQVYNLSYIYFEIDSLISKYPKESNYLNGMRSSIDESQKFSSPLQSDSTQ
jgi:insertion element IS1 protein InsB